MHRLRWLLSLTLLTACDGSAPPPPAPVPVPTPAASTQPATSQPAADPAATRPAAQSPVETETFATLDAGLARVAELEAATDFNAAFNLVRHLREQFPDNASAARIHPVLMRLRDLRTQANELLTAVANLDSPSRRAALIARDELVNGGEVGRRLLRKALHEGSPRAALFAAEGLAEMRDAESVPVILDRLEQADTPVLRNSLADVVRSMAEDLPADAVPRIDALFSRPDLVTLAIDVFARRREPAGPMRFLALLEQQPDPALQASALAALRSTFELIPADAWPRLHQLAQADSPLGRDAAALLVEALNRNWEGDPAAFDRAVGLDGAHAALQQRVEAALASADPAVAEWARLLSVPMGLAEPGLLGRYYAGREFETFLIERIDPVIDFIDAAAFALPAGRTEDFSARWTGFLRVPATGQYTIYSIADDGQRIVLGGAPAIDDWIIHPEKEVATTLHLRRGWHPITVEFMQGPVHATIRLSWQGPGFDRRPIPREAFATPPRVQP